MSKNVNINIKANSKDAQNGIKKVTGEVDKLKNTLKKSETANFLTSLRGLGTVAKTITSGIKSLVNELNGLNEAYIVQAKAEKQLETACKNNPYLNHSNVKALEDFASEMQKVSTVGDEELLPLMAQLASSGRTQVEIQDIITASLDLSASGAMSLESAVQNLNKSYSGTVGQLAKVSPSIKNLTKEQLENGDAVKLIAQQYKGMAKETADATGSTQQFKNAWGDLKEEIGVYVNKVFSPLQKFFTTIVSGWSSALSGLRKYKEELHKEDLAKTAAETGNATKDQLDLAIESYEKQLNDPKYLEQVEETKQLIQDTKDALAYWRKEGYAEDSTVIIENIEYLRKQEEELKKLLDVETKLEDAQRQKRRIEREAQWAEEDRLAKEKQNKIDALYAEYNATVDAKQKEIDYKRKAHIEISEIEEKDTMIATKTAAAFKLISDGLGDIDENDELFKKIIADIDLSCEELDILLKKQEEAKKNNDKEEGGTNPKDLDKTLLDKWAKETKSELEQLEEEFKILNELKAEFGTSENLDQFTLAINNCQKAIDDLNFENLKNNLLSVMDTVINGLSTLQNDINNLMNLSIQESNNKAQKEIDTEKERYEAGIISFDEYEEKKNKIEKDAAQKEYKIKIAQWSMDLAMTQAKSAQAVVNALASGTPPVNIINSVTAGVVGAGQLAILMASRPKPPTFSTGGFLTGNSTRGDKIPFMGNAGEAILNPAEQRAFLELANGNNTNAKKGNTVLNMPINIENNASKDVEVSATQSENAIIVTVNKIVKSSLENGSYNNSLTVANQSMKGAKYL